MTAVFAGFPPAIQTVIPVSNKVSNKISGWNDTAISPPLPIRIPNDFTTDGTTRNDTPLPKSTPPAKPIPPIRNICLLISPQICRPVIPIVCSSP